MVKDFFKKAAVAVIGDFGEGRRPEQIKGWIENGGGQYSSSLKKDTTHVVFPSATWKRQSSTVQQALDRDDLKIVSLDWLEECIHKKRSVRTGQYEWPKLDKAAMKKAKQKERHKSKPPSYVTALQEHTEKYTQDDASSTKAYRAATAGAENLGQQAEAKAREAFKRGSKAAKFDLRSDDYHIYEDPTGFRMEVTVSKVETSRNWNERAIITLYESNTEPKGYACYVKSVGTYCSADGSMLAAVGSNFATAFKQFRNVFEHKTNIEWDDRFEKCSRRRGGPVAQAPPAKSNDGHFITSQMVIAAGGARGPVNDHVADETLKMQFEAKRFVYRLPPVEEPQGCIPPGKTPLPMEAPAAVVTLQTDLEDSYTTTDTHLAMSCQQTAYDSEAPSVHKTSDFEYQYHTDQQPDTITTAAAYSPKAPTPSPLLQADTGPLQHGADDLNALLLDAEPTKIDENNVSGQMTAGGKQAVGGAEFGECQIAPALDTTLANPYSDVAMNDTASLNGGKESAPDAGNVVNPANVPIDLTDKPTAEELEHLNMVLSQIPRSTTGDSFGDEWNMKVDGATDYQTPSFGVAGGSGGLTYDSNDYAPAAQFFSDSMGSHHGTAQP